MYSKYWSCRKLCKKFIEAHAIKTWQKECRYNLSLYWALEKCALINIFTLRLRTVCPMISLPLVWTLSDPHPSGSSGHLAKPFVSTVLGQLCVIFWGSPLFNNQPPETDHPCTVCLGGKVPDLPFLKLGVLPHALQSSRRAPTAQNPERERRQEPASLFFWEVRGNDLLKVTEITIAGPSTSNLAF